MDQPGSTYLEAAFLALPANDAAFRLDSIGTFRRAKVPSNSQCSSGLSSLDMASGYSRMDPPRNAIASQDRRLVGHIDHHGSPGDQVSEKNENPSE